MADKDAEQEEEKEEDDSPDSEEPASEKPAPEEEKKAEAEKPDAAAATKATESTTDKPVSKSVEWAIAIAMMVVLIGFLFLMMHMMRSARSAVM